MLNLPEDLVDKAKSSIFSWLIEEALTQIWKDNPWLKTPLIRYCVKFVVTIIVGALLKKSNFMTVIMQSNIAEMSYEDFKLAQDFSRKNISTLS